MLRQQVLGKEAFRSVLAWFLHVPCRLCRNRVLPSSSWKQPRAMAIAHTVLGVSWALIAKNEKGGLPCRAPGFYHYCSFGENYHLVCQNSLWPRHMCTHTRFLWISDILCYSSRIPFSPSLSSCADRSPTSFQTWALGSACNPLSLLWRPLPSLSHSAFLDSEIISGCWS